MVNGASSEPLLHGHNGVRIVMGEHSSSLSFYATNAGQAKYRCSVMLGFPSPDPNITINANSTVNVIGKWINVQYISVLCVIMIHVHVYIYKFSL